MKKILHFMKQAGFGIIAVLLMGITETAAGQSERYRIYSPDRTIQVQIETGDKLSYSVSYGDQKILRENALSLKIQDGTVFGDRPQVVEVNEHVVTDTTKPVVPFKFEKLEHEYRELQLTFKKSFKVAFRVYNEGVAYRFMPRHPSDSIRIADETTQFNFAGDYRILFPREQSIHSHYERLYIDTTLSGLSNGAFCSLPTTLQTPEGVTLAISDADLFSYPNMFLESVGKQQLKARFPKRVLETKPTSDRNETITRKAEGIAKVSGNRNLPWRAMKISPDAASLLENTLFFKLARPLALEETDWIDPGKVAWDWWNALNIYDVPFESGVNMKTYKYYIDFAARHDLDYVILDEGWSNTTDLLDVNEDLDLPKLVSYAEQRDVGLILWMLWKPLQRDMKRYMSAFEEWGIRGIKVDFMQRGDQDMVRYYERVAQTAAEHHLLVNFHGSFKPAGLRRAYPNVMTYEGVRGLEHSKWSDVVTPTHDVTLPFTRMAAGPMDFTPGSVINAHKDNFRAIYTRPMSQGTRAHQVAMYAIYESGLQMLADSPSHYEEEPKTTDFISRFPVTWHETRALEANLAEYLIMARRHDRTWYVGAMTSDERRSGKIDLSFLEEGVTYRATLFKDGINADRYAEDFQISEQVVRKGDVLSYDMVKGGGWAAIIEPVAEKN